MDKTKCHIRFKIIGGEKSRYRSKTIYNVLTIEEALKIFHKNIYRLNLSISVNEVVEVYSCVMFKDKLRGIRFGHFGGL